MRSSSLFSSLLVATVVAVAPACVDDVDDLDDDTLPDGPATADSGEDDGKADTASGERTVRAGQLTVTITSATTRRQIDGRFAVVIRATTSRNITGVFSFVPDDAFGEATVTGPRSFEVVLKDGYELNSILSGLGILVRIETATGTSIDYTARIDLGARFARFSGSSRINIDSVIRPIYAVDPVNPLRYQGKVTTTKNLASLTATTDDDVDATVSLRGARTAVVDWTYDWFAVASDPPTDPVYFFSTFTDSSTASKQAGIDVRAVRVGLTTEDPYEVWQAPTCTSSRLSCLLALPDGAPDWGSCGSYRETQVCAYAHQCEIVGEQDFALIPTSADTSYAMTAWNDACPEGGSWCHLDAIEHYRLPPCAVASLDEVVDAVLATTQDAPRTGTTVDDAQLGQSVFFGTSYSPAGPSLLGSLDGWQGSTDADAWIGVEEVPCHNCTNFVDRTILFYPETGSVFVLTGGHGYDS